MFEISTVSHAGLRQLTFALADVVARHRAEVAAKPAPERIVIRPKGAEEDFRIRVEGGSYGPLYRILGDKPVRWVQQTDFTNDEAVGYLADRLAKLGVEDGLFRAGATPGATVVIGEGDGVIFDWDPSLTSAAELITAPRGTDARIDAVEPPHDLGAPRAVPRADGCQVRGPRRARIGAGRRAELGREG